MNQLIEDKSSEEEGDESNESYVHDWVEFVESKEL